MPVVAVYSGLDGTLLRQFNPFRTGVRGVAAVSLREDNGVLELVVSDPGQGTVILDTDALLSGRIRVLGGTHG